MEKKKEEEEEGKRVSEVKTAIYLFNLPKQRGKWSLHMSPRGFGLRWAYNGPICVHE